MSLLSFLLFFQGFPFKLFWNASHTRSFIGVTNLAALFCIFSSSSRRSMLWGSQTELPYSRTGRTSPLYADSLTSFGHAAKLFLRKPWVLLAFMQMLLTCVFHFKSLEMVMPRYGIFSTLSRTVPSKV